MKYLNAILICTGLYLYNMGVMFTWGINTVLCGKPGETFSSRVGREALYQAPWALTLERWIDWIFYVFTGEEDHCLNSYMHPEPRRAVRELWVEILGKAE